jgi:hypothetical protein
MEPRVEAKYLTPEPRPVATVSPVAALLGCPLILRGGSFLRIQSGGSTYSSWELSLIKKVQGCSSSQHGLWRDGQNSRAVPVLFHFELILFLSPYPPFPGLCSGPHSPLDKAEFVQKRQLKIFS